MQIYHLTVLMSEGQNVFPWPKTRVLAGLGSLWRTSSGEDWSAIPSPQSRSRSSVPDSSLHRQGRQPAVLQPLLCLVTLPPSYEDTCEWLTPTVWVSSLSREPLI